MINPHLQFPLKLLGTAFGQNEQDSADDVTACVLVLVSTVQGERDDLPQYGIPDVLFTTQINPDTLSDAIEAWEPRAPITTTTEIVSNDLLQRTINVRIDSAGGIRG